MVTSTIQVQGTIHLTTGGIKKDLKYRTCCDCCHITHGTVFLGIIELIAVSILLISLIQQVLWKHNDSSNCLSNPTLRMLRDCLLFNFSHFNVTLAGDYIIALLMMSILFCIVLLFCGILSVTPSLIFPHIIIQGLGLFSSIGYFVLYAWSYFYGDLYTQKKQFAIQSFIERMWFATILLIFSGFQLYLFFTVIKCTLYLQMIRNEQYRKFNQFEEVRKRVRIAKENGLWRTGGGFLQYKGQEEDERKKKEKKDHKKKPKGVQWNMERNQEKEITDTNTESEDDFKKRSEDVNEKHSFIEDKSDDNILTKNTIKEIFYISSCNTQSSNEKYTNDTQSRSYFNNNSSKHRDEITYDSNRQTNSSRSKTSYAQQRELIRTAIHSPTRMSNISKYNNPVVKKVSISSTNNQSQLN
uniref:Transmembrane protein n=1 Tax=Parastrongyloides trichosuri TaxID=131310 RepID=A0A0N4ZP51_PARTI